MITVVNCNEALIMVSRLLVQSGEWRETRGFRCLEIPYPVVLEICNPTDRYITIPIRKWAKTLPFAELLALTSGTNHLELYSSYSKKIADYSDDGQYVRAGYGPRIRAYSGFSGDYKVDHPSTRHVFSGSVTVVDQLKYCIDILKKDINTRQASITIHDPAKDCFEGDNLKVTKDIPCSRLLQFMVVNGKLNCTAYLRSNDILWGASAVNWFNFTFIQEIVANIIGIPIGKYYHIANNMHCYEDRYDLVRDIARTDSFNYLNISDLKFQYPVISGGLEEFDNNLRLLFNYEEKLRTIHDPSNRPKFTNELFHDWANVFEKYHMKIDKRFINPLLNNLFYGK